MKRTFATIIILATIIIALFTGILLTKSDFSKTSDNPPKAYVGVTYCGDSVAQAKLLIDKVKEYTNLFVLQSGLLERDLNSVTEVGNYAVSAGMYFLPYFGNFVEPSFSAWLQTAKQNWGTHLLGVYYSDEPGGKMLDAYVTFNDSVTGDSITKTKYGDVVVQKIDGTVIQYEMNGNIKLYQPDRANISSDIDNEATFYSNGSIEIVRAQSGLSDFSYKNYQELSSIRPFTDLNDTSQRFLERDKNNIDDLKNSTKIFTSDYALYWFDYLSGYDVILGQIGWNISVTQQIAFLRGAATVQNKDWGIFITWKYQQWPYLANGTEILNQMTTAYESGAKYLVLFNYYDSNQTPYGTLQPEHFQALQTFWNNVINNPKEVQSSIKADTVLVLPQNYGWGARWETDHIWGIFASDNETEQYWSLMQTTLQNHGLKTDIVYADQKFPFPNIYQNIYRTG
jgi:hypothetical protein